METQTKCRMNFHEVECMHSLPHCVLSFTVYLVISIKSITHMRILNASAKVYLRMSIFFHTTRLINELPSKSTVEVLELAIWENVIMSCCSHFFQKVTHLIYFENTRKLYDGDSHDRKRFPVNQYQNDKILWGGR